MSLVVILIAKLYACSYDLPLSADQRSSVQLTCDQAFFFFGERGRLPNKREEGPPDRRLAFFQPIQRIHSHILVCFILVYLLSFFIIYPCKHLFRNSSLRLCSRQKAHIQKKLKSQRKVKLSIIKEHREFFYNYLLYIDIIIIIIIIIIITTIFTYTDNDLAQRRQTR